MHITITGAGNITKGLDGRAETDYTYSYHPGTDGRTILLLHAVGGDERAMDQIGQLLEPDGNLLSPKGPVIVDGHARYFTRRADASFDPIEVTRETDNLARFTVAARTQHQLLDDQLIAIGYSNGANMIASLLANHPTLIKKAILSVTTRVSRRC